MGTLKPQSNGPLYSNTVIGTLALMDGLLHLVQRGGAWAASGPTQSPRCTKRNNPLINGSVPTSYYSTWHYNYTHNFIHQSMADTKYRYIDISVRREKIYIYKQKINRCKVILTTAN